MRLCENMHVGTSRTEITDVSFPAKTQRRKDAKKTRRGFLLVENYETYQIHEQRRNLASLAGNEQGKLVRHKD